MAVLARKELPEAYAKWNASHHAPYGRSMAGPLGRIKRMTRAAASIRWRGPYAWQGNNTTREFEYPWAADQLASIGSCLNIVELGGGLSGLQFTLASQGHRVINVDPGLEAAGVGFDLDEARHARLSGIFGQVDLRPTTIAHAGLTEGDTDLLLAVSVLEHFASEDLDELAREARRILRPGGWLVCTLDLFIDLIPFTSRARNEWGENVNVEALLARCGFRLVHGDPEELNGFAVFDAERVQAGLGGLLLGRGYPALTQCVVAQLEPEPSEHHSAASSQTRQE